MFSVSAPEFASSGTQRITMPLMYWFKIGAREQTYPCGEFPIDGQKRSAPDCSCAFVSTIAGSTADITVVVCGPGVTVEITPKLPTNVMEPVTAAPGALM